MKLRYFRYRFPFIRPFRTSSNTLIAREGIIIQLHQNGITAYGEAAPLPGRSPESLSQVISQLKTHASDINRLFQDEIAPGDLDDFFHRFDVVPSLRFALDTLAYNYSIQTKADYTLFDESSKLVPVNTVIPIRSETETLQAAGLAKRNGYDTFKLKIGRDFSRELALLKKLRVQFPEVTLRLDANQAWDVEEAICNLNKMQNLRIEYCEEPISQPTLSALNKISKSTLVPLALDETLTDFTTIRKVIPFVPVLVLKPMIIGRFSDLFATKRLADAHEHKVVLTTMLESGVGRLMTAILASEIGSHHTAHGLATGSLLAVDIWRDGSYIQKGYFSLSGDAVPVQKVRSDLKYIAEEIFFPGG